MESCQVMNPRFKSIRDCQTRAVPLPAQKGYSSDDFGRDVFSLKLMESCLPASVYENVRKAMRGEVKIQPECADVIAKAMKDWAILMGATHYTHWFHPMTGGTAEKHDAFIDWHSEGKVIEKFDGKQLLIGEPDASSFPSGGLRSTFEARGYTGWDPSSPVFIWRGGDGVTLCIPSVFFSWRGDVLDWKIPLLRSEEKFCKCVKRLLRLTGRKEESVFVTCGFEQEYFLIDKALRDARPDLLLCGRTLCGRESPKGQELQDHYFASVKDRVLRYMQEVENLAIRLGIPLKTRHNEVAPSQHEAAPAFERASLAIDHNLLLMEIMRQTAGKMDLSCLLHEKPFAGLNGSGKHANWSCMTESGINLLDPTDTPENNWHFLILLAAIVDGLHRHAPLIRASIASASNDLRLGGHEAPPAILSIYLGETLERLLNNLERSGAHTSALQESKYDLKIPIIPDLPKDQTDRNRTSPFAFTGNKFEFRALGSSQNPSLAITLLNLVTAESLDRLLNEMEEDFPQKAIPVLQKVIKRSNAIRFSGDNYSEEWKNEANRRGLGNIGTADAAYQSLLSPETAELFNGILEPGELRSRYEVLMEIYIHMLLIEGRMLGELAETQVLPAAISYQNSLASGAQSSDILQQRSTELLQLIEEAMEYSSQLTRLIQEIKPLPIDEGAKQCSEALRPLCENLRNRMDSLEAWLPDQQWPLLKYRELLFMTM